VKQQHHHVLVARKHLTALFRGYFSRLATTAAAPFLLASRQNMINQKSVYVFTVHETFFTFCALLLLFHDNVNDVDAVNAERRKMCHT